MSTTVATAAGTHPALVKFLEKTVPLHRKGGEDLAATVRASENKVEVAFASLVKSERAFTFHSTPHEEIVQKIAVEYEKLCNDPRVAQVTSSRIARTLFVQTVELFTKIPDTDLRVSIGELKIEIDPMGRKFGVKVENLTRRVDGSEKRMNTPLIGADGRCFSGQILTALATLIGRHEYYEVVKLVIQSIERGDPNDPWNANTKLWPLAGVEGNK